MKKFIKKQKNKTKIVYNKPEVVQKLKPPRIPLFFVVNKKTFKS